MQQKQSFCYKSVKMSKTQNVQNFFMGIYGHLWTFMDIFINYTFITIYSNKLYTKKFNITKNILFFLI